MREATGERAKNRTNFNLSERQDKQTGRRSSDNGRTLAIITKLGLRSSSRLACYRNADLEQPITAPAIVAPHTVNNRAFGSFQVSPSRSVRRSCVIPRRRDQLRESHHRSSPLSWLKRRSGFVILRHLPHKLACRGQQAEASGQWGPFVGKAWRYQRTADANTGMSGEEGRGHLTNGRTSTKGGEGIYT
jgi:hypothetical protein